MASRPQKPQPRIRVVLAQRSQVADAYGELDEVWTVYSRAYCSFIRLRRPSEIAISGSAMDNQIIYLETRWTSRNAKITGGMIAVVLNTDRSDEFYSVVGNSFDETGHRLWLRFQIADSMLQASDRTELTKIARSGVSR